MTAKSNPLDTRAGKQTFGFTVRGTAIAICCGMALAWTLWHLEWQGVTRAQPAADAGAVGSGKKEAEAKGGKDLETRKVEPERAQFRALLLGNPNYFGNLKDSVLKPQIMFKLGNTTYEELKCVGFNTQFDRLEAVVHIKQDGGYGSDVCGGGTLEYVRFYVDWNNDGKWADQGITSFTANNIPGVKPLEYDATLGIDPKRKFCHVENLPRVRAILSWNNPPPPNAPNFPPVWGNVLEARIQIAPLFGIPFSDFLDDAKITLPPDVKAALDLKQSIAAAKPQALNALELHKLYREAKVPEHRYLFADVQKLMAQAESPEALTVPGFKGLAPELKIDLAKVIDQIIKTDGNTSFEELKCVGLNPNQDTLVGVLTVKKSSGYSGGLCFPGSQEYVAFWVDWADGAGWTYAGTAQATVHDIAKITAEGLQYAVFVPVDLSQHRQPCHKGARTARVRAILSWQVPPPPGNPNYVPTWGNREETLIHIKPGPVVGPGDHKPYLESVGGAAVCNINQATGMASGERPFGAVINITGFIPAPPDVTATAMKYKVYVRQPPNVGPWQPLANSFDISVIEQIGGGLPIGYNLTQQIDPSDGFYTYREDPNPAGGGWRLVQNRMLAQWVTAAPMTGLWEIKIEAKDPVSATLFSAGTIACPIDGSTRTNVTVKLDEVRPTAELKITGFSRAGGPVQAAMDCATFQIGDVIFGTYKTEDEHFGALSFSVEPSGPANGATVNPPSRTYGFPDFVPTTGEAGTWSLKTKGMDPCGYVVRFNVADRTIVSGNGPWRNEAFVGFCLEKAAK